MFDQPLQLLLPHIEPVSCASSAQEQEAREAQTVTDLLHSFGVTPTIHREDDELVYVLQHKDALKLTRHFFALLERLS